MEMPDKRDPELVEIGGPSNELCVFMQSYSNDNDLLHSVYLAEHAAPIEVVQLSNALRKDRVLDKKRHENLTRSQIESYQCRKEALWKGGTRRMPRLGRVGGP